MSKRRGNGEGSIYKRKDGTWSGQVTIGRDPETGKLKRPTVYGRTRKEVQEKIYELLGKVQTNTYTEPTKITIGEWLDKWLNDYMKPSLRITTWESYSIQVKKHIKPSIGFIKLLNLQTGHLQRLYNEKLQEGNLSTRSIRYIHTVIHSALEQAVKERLISINPAKAVKLPQLQRKEMQTLDSEGLKIFLQEARKSRYYTAFLLELSTGLRRGELLGLRWKDVDLQKCTLSVYQQLVRTPNGLEFQEPKTKLSRRTVNIPDNIIKELKTHKAKQAQERLLLGEAYNNHGLVFCTELGTPIDPRNFLRQFQTVLKNAKLPNMRFHDLRHTFATLSLQEGVSAKAIQEILGHHSPAFTMSVYSHVTEKMKHEASDKIGNLLTSCINN